MLRRFLAVLAARQRKSRIEWQRLRQRSVVRHVLAFEPCEARHLLSSVPLAVDDPTFSTAVNTTLNGSGIMSNDWDPDGGTLTVSVVANPSHGSLTSFTGSTGAFTYVPTTGYSGLDSFTYKVSDGSLDSNVATVRIAVGGNFGVRTNADEIPRDGMLLTGGLTLMQPLLMDQNLVYRSDSYPRPIVVVETSLLSSSAVPSSIDAQLTFGGISGSTVSYNTTGLSAGDPLRFALQVDASSLATGYYDYTLTLTAWISGNSYSRSYTGSQAVVNRSSSEFGGGWWLDGLDKLVTNANGALLVQGNGDTLWFSSNGSGGYNKAVGDADYSVLVKNANNTYTLTSKQGLARNFSTTGLLTSVVDLNSNTTSFTYTDADGDSVVDELSKITDPFSRDINLTYSSGRLSSISDFAGRSTSLAYTSTRLTSVTLPDPDGAGSQTSPVVSYAYDATTYLLTSQTDPLNHATQFAYNSSSRRLSTITNPDSTTTQLLPVQTIGLASGTGNALSKPADAVGVLTDERGKQSKYKTDRFGGIVEWTDPLSNKTLIVRNSNGLVSKITAPDPDGAGALTSPVTTLGYNAASDPVKVYQPDGAAITRTFDSSNHQLLTESDEMSRTWTFTVDSAGNRLTAKDAAGNVWNLAYNSRGQVTSVTSPDPDGAGSLTAMVTSYTYDSSGRLTKETNPDSTYKSLAYNSADRVTSITDELGYVTSFAWDALDRQTSVTDPLSAVTSAVYNAAGLVTSKTDALSNVTDFEYDSRNRLTKVKLPDPDGAGSLTRTEISYGYDSAGNMTSEGGLTYTSATNYTYDDAGRRTKMTQPGSLNTSYSLDNLGRITAITDPAGNVTSREFDSRSRLTKVTQDADGAGPGAASVYQTAYNAASQKTSETDPRGYTTSYSYDSRGLLSKTTAPDPDGSGPYGSPVWTYSYDALGREISERDPFSRETKVVFNQRGLVVTKLDPDPACGTNYPTTQYAYNSAGQLTSVTDPLSRVTSFALDKLGRVTRRTDPDPDGAGALTSPTTDYAYNALGTVTSVTDPRGYVTAMEYDNLQRTTKVTYPDPDGAGSQSSPVETYTYGSQNLLTKITNPLSHDTSFAYDGFGRRTTVTDHQGNVTTTAYDGLSRVTSVTAPDPDGKGSLTAPVTS